MSNSRGPGVAWRPRIRRRPVSRYVARSILCVTLLCWMPSLAAQEVVINPSVSQEVVARSTLRAIFGMRLRNWPDNMPIVVFVLHSDDPIHAAFTKQTLDMFPHQLQRAWNRLVYSGTGQAPMVVSSPQEMADRVAATPGAVGYLGRDWIDEKLRVLIVQ